MSMHAVKPASVMVHLGSNFVPAEAEAIEACVRRLRANPADPALDLRAPAGAYDPRVRLARVNENLQAVLFELDAAYSTVFALVRVAATAEAEALARRVTMSLNTVTGETITTEVEVEDVDVDVPAAASSAEVEPEQPAQSVESAPPAQPSQSAGRPVGRTTPTPGESLAAAGITTADLERELGMPTSLAQAILGAADESALDAILTDATPIQRDATFGLVAGMTMEEVRDELGLNSPTDSDAHAEAPADTTDALVSSLQRSAHWIDPSEHELRTIITQGSFVEWTTFLHPSQRRAVTANFSGAGRLLGAAGTGKTVVLLHRARELARRATEDPSRSGRPARILLTTFTKSLASQLKSQMGLLDPSYAEARYPGQPGMWIAGIDSVIHGYVTNAPRADIHRALREGLGIDAAMTPQMLDGKQARDMWVAAAELNGEGLAPGKLHPEFLNAEYTDIILAHSITEQKDYLRVSRAGRGTALNRSERKIVWSIVESFLHKCSLAGRLTFPAMAVLGAHIIEQRGEPLFDHILVDEAQDFHAGHWRFIRAAAAPGPNDIYLAEDSHQRIYGNRLVLSRFGISTRGRATRRLSLNYRTTAQNLAYASAILDGVDWVDSEGDTETLTGYRSVRTGPVPRIIRTPTEAANLDTIADIINGWLADAGSASPTTDHPGSIHIGVLARGRNTVSMLVSNLNDRDISTSTQRSGVSSMSSPVSVMTMHNSKGMEFTHVILAGVSDKALPRTGAAANLPPAERDEAIQRERALLYVAASRARDELVITMAGNPSPLLPEERSEVEDSTE